MTIEQIIAILTDQGALLGLSIFTIWMLNRVWESRLDETKRHAVAEGEVRAQVHTAIVNNTRIITKLCEKLAE